MKVVVQRCKESSVMVDEKKVGKIDFGYVLLVGFSTDDNKQVVDKMVNKIINLRIFSDNNDKLNLSIKDVNGEILSISQFTLYAKLNGRRPSFTKALGYDKAKALYEYFNDKLSSNNIFVSKGKFGADMKVSIINDGPVTIIIDSKEDLK